MNLNFWGLVYVHNKIDFFKMFLSNQGGYFNVKTEMVGHFSQSNTVDQRT